MTIQVLTKVKATITHYSSNYYSSKSFYTCENHSPQELSYHFLHILTFPSHIHSTLILTKKKNPAFCALSESWQENPFSVIFEVGTSLGIT